MMISYGYELDKLVKELRFVPYELKKGTKHEAGKIYWCGYWHKAYKVLAVDGSKVTVEWEDGKTSAHMTSLDYHHDYELREFEFIKPFRGDTPESILIAYDPYVDTNSYTGAELKAMCYLGIFDIESIDSLYDRYFEPKDSEVHPINMNNYYFFYRGTVNKGWHGFVKDWILKRDIDKSPKKERKNNG